jgi:lipopolysaccharide/colanic/teichoic acid biosynthesis glycosyltransferase
MTISFPEFPGGYSVTEKGSAPSGAPTELQTRRGVYRNGLKRFLDIAAIVMAAPVVMPMVAVLAVLVVQDGGPAFYTQQRVGRNGRWFRMWKLRSMVPDADSRMAEHLEQHPAARAEWDSTQKLKHDPRITPFGQFLRRTSMDELPQLWNVLIGDMSLVGPRPMMTAQQTLYPGTAYYGLRPGITGYWQTAGRNATTFEARAGFDTAYEADLSLATDAAVLLRTVGVVMKATGY